MKAYALFLFSFIIFVGLNGQDEIRILENCGSIYSDDNQLRKEILKEIEANGFASIELYGTPLNDQILILQKAIIPILWEFPDKCSFRYYPILIDEKEDSIGSNDEARRILKLMLQHENKYNEYLYTRGKYVTLGNNRVKFSFDKKAAIENIGMKDSQLSESNQINVLLKIGKDSIEKAVEVILSSEEKKEEIMTKHKLLLKPLVTFGLWGIERKGIFVTQEQLDSSKLILEKRFFKNYAKRLALLKVNDKSYDEPGNLLLMDFLRAFYPKKNKEADEKKLNEYLIKENGNCPNIRLEQAFMPEDAGFWLSYFPHKERKKAIEYNLKVTHNDEVVYNKKVKEKGGYINTKLPFLPKVIGDEICFEVEIQSAQEPCKKYSKCFALDCPKVKIDYTKSEFECHSISTSDEKFSRVIVKGKGYDQHENLLEEIRKSIDPDRPVRFNGHCEDIWENRSWKKKHVKKTCLSFEVLNLVTNQKIESCPLPKDTCLNIKPYKDILENAEYLTKNRSTWNEFDVEVKKIKFEKGNCAKYRTRSYWEIFFEIQDPNATPPFTVYYKNSMKSSKEREFSFKLNLDFDNKIAASTYYYHVEIIDGNNLGKSFPLKLKLDSTFNYYSIDQIKEKLEQLEGKHKPTIITAKDPATNNGFLLGMDIPNVNYKWNNGSTQGNLLNVKPGKYEITYRGCDDSIKKEFEIPYWDSKIEKEIIYNPPGKDTALGIIKFKLKSEFLPYRFYLPLRGRQWRDTLVNDTVFVVKNLSKGYHRFKVDNPETGLEEFTVKVWKCDDIPEPKALLKSPKKRRSKDGMIRLAFPIYSVDTEYDLIWDNGIKGFVNYGLKKGKHKLRIDNGFGCQTDFEFELE